MAPPLSHFAPRPEPVRPRCGCLAVYEYRARRVFRCQGCGRQFSVTSGMIFASRKKPIRDYLLAIALFVNDVRGLSALQLSRDLDCQMAFVLAHKLREALAAEQKDGRLSAVRPRRGRWGLLCRYDPSGEPRG